MLTSTPYPQRTVMPAFLALLMVLIQGASGAQAGTVAEQKHVFILERLELPKGAPEELESLVRQSFLKTVESNGNLLSKLPEGAPPVDVNDKGLQGNKPFRKFMKERKLTAYNVVVQVTDFEQPVAPNPSKPGNIISCVVQLRIFGETIPDRVMAFSGDGSASVAVEVGKKVRKTDRKYATTEALDLAVAEGISMSLKKLKAKPEPPPKKKKKKRRATKK